MSENPAVESAQDDEPPCTTKRVTATLTATFHGDYIGVDEIPGVLEGWIDAGLYDRDDLRGWNFTVTNIDVVTGDPEGYDS